MDQRASTVGGGEAGDTGEFIGFAESPLERLEIFDPDPADDVGMMLHLAGIRVGVAMKRVHADTRAGCLELHTKRAVTHGRLKDAADVESNEELLEQLQ